MKKIVIVSILFCAGTLFFSCISTGKCINGDCKNGQGVYQFYDCCSYKGKFQNGKFNGKGTLIQKFGRYTDYTKYEGEWKNGKRHGKGTCQYLYSGYTYKGRWKDDMAHGKGTLTGPDTEYTGSWENHKMHGKGSLKFTKLDIIYTGNFKDGLIEQKNSSPCLYGDCTNGKGIYALDSSEILSGKKMEEKNDEIKDKIKRRTIEKEERERHRSQESSMAYGDATDKKAVIKKYQAIYAGSFKNGKFHGTGAVYDAYLSPLFFGNWKEGKKDGRGVLYHVFGKKELYNGEYRDDLYHGNGVENYSGGSIRYSGGWSKGMYHGRGTSYHKNGQEEIICVWNEGKKNGPGVVYNGDGAVVEEGVWEKDEYIGRCIAGDCENGYGTFLYENGGAYKGSFKNGMREGKGVYRYKNGDYWKGVFHNDGFYTGIGASYSNDGYYIGPLYENKKNGFGVLFESFGGSKKYKGHWKNGKREGMGIEYKNDRPHYMGMWKNDQYNGQGTIYH